MFASGAGGRRGFAAGLALCAAFIGIQAAGTHSARRLLEDAAAPSRLLDAALTAYPANPLCWNFVTTEARPGADAYRLRRGVLSLAPGLMPVSACPAGLTGPVSAPGGSAIAVLDDENGSLAALRARAGADCYFNAWLRFARAPLLAGSVASDLRFGTTLAPNFSTIELDHFKGRACPSAVPPWGMPRADLLGQ